VLKAKVVQDRAPQLGVSSQDLASDAQPRDGRLVDHASARTIRQAAPWPSIRLDREDRVAYHFCKFTVEPDVVIERPRVHERSITGHGARSAPIKQIIDADGQSLNVGVPGSERVSTRKPGATVVFSSPMYW
jgi:hypothetical protein